MADQDEFFADIPDHPARAVLLQLAFQLDDMGSYVLIAQRFREWGLTDRLLGALDDESPTCCVLKTVSEVGFMYISSALTTALGLGSLVLSPGSKWSFRINAVSTETVEVTHSRADSIDDIDVVWGCTMLLDKRDLAPQPSPLRKSMLRKTESIEPAPSVLLGRKGTLRMVNVSLHVINCGGDKKRALQVHKTILETIDAMNAPSN